MEFSKSDWKLFRACIAEWQENYMERLVKEYIDMLNGNGNASDKFWELEERIKKDKKHPGVMLFFASTFWTKLQNIFGHYCKSKLDKVAKPRLAAILPAA